MPEQPPRYTMLIVDDTRMNRTMLSRIFRDTYIIRVAENGREAMDILRSEKIDVMLLDIMMPEMDGFEVIEAVRSDEALKHLPIIVTTAEKDQTERKALAMGADEYISKPYDSVVVEKRVSNITRMHILERERMEKLLREQRQRADALLRQAETDPLTQVYNRMGAQRQITDILDDDPGGSAYLMIDVDNFKHVNDTFGHPIGDELLKRLAAKFQTSVRAGDVVGRVGGDEFAVYLRGTNSREAVMALANRLIEEARHVRDALGLGAAEAISIGIAYAKESGNGLEALYDTADRALYLAKQAGKGCAAMLDLHTTMGYKTY